MGRRGGKPHGLGGVPRHAAAAFAHHPQVILTTRIAGFRVGLSGLVCRENVAALFGGFGGSKIGGDGPDPQHEEDNCDNIRHCGPRLMLAARSKLFWFESKFRPRLNLPPPHQHHHTSARGHIPWRSDRPGPPADQISPKLADQ